MASLVVGVVIPKWQVRAVSYPQVYSILIAERAKLSVKHAEERRQKRFQERDNSTTCFACRSVGHAARDCPNVLLALEKGGEGSATLLGDEAPEQPAQNRGMKRKPGKKGGDLVGGKCYR